MTIEDRRALRVALFGWPGAGKSTTAAMLRQALAESGRQPAVVRIAAPLYDVQRSFYARAGTSLADGQQDGVLLNFLGSHFRAAAPGFLLTDFGQRCASALLCGADTIICDDARPVDLAELAGQGFSIVRISAPDEIRGQRKSGRGDRIAGNDRHPTELGVDAVSPDFEIDNSGSLAELQTQLASLVQTLSQPAARQDRYPDAPDALEMLVRQASRAITPRYAENRHQIGAVLLAADGQVFTGIQVEAMVGRASVCAEAVALGKACEAGAVDLRVVLALRHPKPGEANREIRLVPPCGLCRELLLDYGRDIRAVIETEGQLGLVPLAQLLPHKYVGTKWAAAADPVGTAAG
jgi:cytidine deaminase